MAKLLTLYPAEERVNMFLNSILKDCHCFFLQYRPFLLGIRTSWTFMFFFVIWCFGFGFNMKTLRRRKMTKDQLQFFLEIGISSYQGAQSFAVEMSFLEVFSLKWTIMASFYLYSYKFIHTSSEHYQQYIS